MNNIPHTDAELEAVEGIRLLAEAVPTYHRYTAPSLSPRAAFYIISTIFRGFARNLETYKMLTRLKAPVDHDPNKVSYYFICDVKLIANLNPSVQLPSNRCCMKFRIALKIIR